MADDHSDQKRASTNSSDNHFEDDLDVPQFESRFRQDGFAGQSAGSFNSFGHSDRPIVVHVAACGESNEKPGVGYALALSCKTLLTWTGRVVRHE